MLIHHGSRWFFRATIPHMATQWPELLPPFGPAIFTQVFSKVIAAGKESIGSLTPSLKCFSLEVTHVTSIHSQWIIGHMALTAAGQRSIILPVPREEPHRVWVSVESLSYSGLSNHTHNELGTGSQCSINRGKWGDEAKSPEQGGGEKRRKRREAWRKCIERI